MDYSYGKLGHSAHLARRERIFEALFTVLILQTRLPELRSQIHQVRVRGAKSQGPRCTSTIQKPAGAPTRTVEEGLKVLA